MTIINYSRLFHDGMSIQPPWGNATIKCHNVAKLAAPSGNIIACDPFVGPERSAFTVELYPGQYPVILNVAAFGDKDQRVAYAMLKLSEKEPVHWEMALLPNQDIASLGEGHIFCYGVDSGTGCFMDKMAARSLIERMAADESYYETLIAEMDKTYVNTWSWANVEMDAGSNANLVAFSTGLGDGCYASYFGFDENKNAVCLVTDFGLFEDEEIADALNIAAR